MIPRCARDKLKSSLHFDRAQRCGTRPHSLREALFAPGEEEAAGGTVVVVLGDELHPLPFAAGPDDVARLIYEVLRQRVDAAGVPADLRDEVIVALVEGDGVAFERGALAGKDGFPNRVALSSDLKNLTQRNVSSPQIAFEHPLAVFDESTRRFNIVTAAPRSDGASGGERGWVVGGRFAAPFRATFIPGNWDRSVSANAPGQSGSPASTRYDDLVEPWRSGDDIILAFTQSAVEAAATDRLLLQP